MWCILFTGTVSVRCTLFTGTVSVNNLFLYGIYHSYNKDHEDLLCSIFVLLVFKDFVQRFIERQINVLQMLILKAGTQHYGGLISVKYWSIWKLRTFFNSEFCGLHDNGKQQSVRSNSGRPVGSKHTSKKLWNLFYIIRVMSLFTCLENWIDVSVLDFTKKGGY